MSKSDIVKPARLGNKGSTSSGIKQQSKRPNSEVSPNSSLDELNVLSHQLEGLTEDVKLIRGDLKSIMKKEDMETFIKSTISEIVKDLTDNMDMTISLKVEEKTKEISQKLSESEKDNEGLRKEVMTLKTQIKNQSEKIEDIDTRSKAALCKSNYNEQYSRKNNVKIMDVAEKANETEQDLINTVTNMCKKKDITINPQKIMAIHRIPGKDGHTKPILVKFLNNTEKKNVMVHRSDFKKMGNRLVDDVTRLNAQLIERLTKHDKIQQAWYFNGSVFGKTNDNRRHKFDLFDNIRDVITA